MIDRRGVIFSAAALSVLIAFTAPARAQVELWETENTEGELRANAQLTTAYVDLGGLREVVERTPGVPLRAGLIGAVGRLVWAADLGEHVDVELHNRLVWIRSELPQDFLSQGVGVSREKDQRLSTELHIVDGDTNTLTHDLDRAVVGVYLPWFDLYVGRQAIRWGVSEMFPVLDRFAPLSPFELDTVQPRGVDAARVITTVARDVEIDAVVADRGIDQPLSVAARAQYSGPSFDLRGGIGRFWQRISAMGGGSWLFGSWKAFAEGELLWNLDEQGFDLPRGTVGIQRTAMNWQIGAEYHYNGFGAAPDEAYVGEFADPELGRGETYFLGRHYAGITGMYLAASGWSTGGGVIANVLDPSAVVFPRVQYEFDQAFSVAAGGYVGIGESAEFSPEPGAEFGGLRFPSEFGGSSDLYYVQMTAFF